MFRCHFTRRNRIVAGENLQAMTLQQAIDEAEEMLGSQPGADCPDGFEIWDCAKLLYTWPLAAGGSRRGC
jgi:hypothetical protein